MNVLTIDLDWCPDPVLKHTLNILEKHDAKATFFATHDTPLMQNQEIGIHPNPGPGYEESMEQLLKTYNTTLLRNHTLYHSNRLFETYCEHGITHTSNTLHHNIPTSTTGVLQPYGITDYPVFFLDDLWVRTGKPSLNTETPGLRIWAFHPVHILLNTSHWQQYTIAKKYYQQPAKLKKHRKEGPGTEKLLEWLLENHETHTIGDLIESNQK